MKPPQAFLTGEVELGGYGGGEEGNVGGFRGQGENPLVHRPHLKMCTLMQVPNSAEERVTLLTSDLKKDSLAILIIFRIFTLLTSALEAFSTREAFTRNGSEVAAKMSLSNS